MTPENKGFNLLEQTQQHLHDTFTEYLVQRAGVSVDMPLRILSVGCSFAEEAQPLTEIFPQSTFEGIDVDERVLRAAQFAYGGNPRISFRVANAREKEEFGGEHDLIIMRNPQVQGSLQSGLRRDSAVTPLAWREIFENSIQNLKQEGVLFVSSSLDTEAQRVVDLVSGSLQPVVLGEQNKFFSARDRYMDSFITVGRKPQ